MDWSILLYLIAAVLVVAGLAGVIVPVLPGLPLVFLGMLVAAWAGDFVHVGGWALLLLGVLALVSVVVDLLASLFGARRVGASRRGIIGAALGTVLGLFAGLPGVILGPFIGAIAGELAHGRRLDTASRIGVGTWVGLLLGTAAKIALGFAMLGVFVVAWLL